ncbi:hypothetical protein [Methylorubrum extorquens]|nr:hypothetical protein [Methylorubrum extorquens]MCP1591995.1 chromosome segregation ATPase [Methylorubrum extorquens]
MATESDDRSKEALEEALAAAEARAERAEIESSALRTKLAQVEKQLANLHRQMMGAGGRRG